MGNNASSSRNETSNARSKRLANNFSGSTAKEYEERSVEIKNSSSNSKTKQVGESAAVVVQDEAAKKQQQQQRSRQQSTWSLGSLSGRLNWSFTGGASRNSFRNRNKSAARKSFISVQQRHSKTTWHRPLTNAIFSSHFKETSRNEHFFIDRLVAKGAFGVVFKVIDKQQLRTIDAANISNEQHVYALKVLKKSKLIEESSVQQIKDEADIQKLCGHHPFIVQQIDLWQNRHNLHILSEYVPNGELFSKIATFSIDLIRLYVAEIALAIDFLHNAGIIYRDAKPENILLTETYHIKLTDFGLSKWLKLGATTKTMCGTFQYMAPEILLGQPYGHAADWWSLGIIACQMFTDRSPNIKPFLDATLLPHTTLTGIDDNDNAGFHERPHCSSVPLSAMCAKLETTSFLPVEVELLTHEAKDVIKRLLEFDPKQRIRSVLALQRIALYKNYKIDTKHLLGISPIDVIAKDNITISHQNLSMENSSAIATMAFHNF